MKRTIFLAMLLAMGLMLALAAMAAFAENIDPDGDDSQYAWGENVGWINLEPGGEGGPGMEVGDSTVKGYMWGENIGWISLSCINNDSCDGEEDVNYGVANDGNGNLWGYAWGENAGWINFASPGGGVFIDPQTGLFSGYAWGENIGWINFAPNGVGVKTAWRGDADGDGYNSAVDCDDTNPEVNPGAVEVCDDKDNDCSTATADGADEAWLGEPCDGSDSDLCEEGVFACVGGVQTCTDETGDTIEIPGNTIDENCDGTTLCDSSAEWKNHGQFVSCVAREAEKLVEQGFIVEEEKGEIVSEAAKSDVAKGKKK